MDRKGVIAVNQILILVIGVIAIGWEMGVVSGEEDDDPDYSPYYSSQTTLSPTIDVVKSIDYPDDGISSVLTSTTFPSSAGSPEVTNLRVAEGTGNLVRYSHSEGRQLTFDVYGKSITTRSFFQEGNNWYYSEGNQNIPINNQEAINQLNKWKSDGTLEQVSSSGKREIPFLGTVAAGSWQSALATGVQWAAGVAAFVGIFGFILPKDGNLHAALTASLSAGAFIGGYVGEWDATKNLLGKGTGIYVGLAVAAIIFYSMYEKESTTTISYTCSAWDAPVGGSKCEECNKQGVLPCSEYQCRSLGQACELINSGTAEERCVWVNRHDVSFPTIDPWEQVLSDGYKYIPDNSISPPDRGVKIVPLDDNEGCVEAFLPLSFGVELNEPAYCKIDYLRKQNFSQMEFDFGGSNLLKYNHTQVMSLPGPNSEENVTLRNDGNFELYVRCRDANGNVNTANFLFKYCVDSGPDTTPPLIISTDILNNFPIGFNKTETPLEVYINEPAECRWSHDDKDFKDMEEDMSCPQTIKEMNAQNVYVCNTILTGLKDRQENYFYLKCKDQPTKPEAERNTNVQPYKFTLIGTQPLILDKVGPNGTVKDATESVKVTLTAKTTAGYKEGLSVCAYSETEDGSYIDFFDTNSYEHSQDLYLGEGTYEYWIKCTDLGGNSDKKSVEFTVDSDSEAPNVVRTYYEENYLKLVTNEKAECVYGISTCNYLFDDGLAMTSGSAGETHYTDWDTKKTLYIKCKDEFGNEPSPSACSMVVRAYSVE